MMTGAIYPRGVLLQLFVQLLTMMIVIQFHMANAYSPRSLSNQQLSLSKPIAQQQEQELLDIQQNIHDLQHQIDLLPSDFFFSRNNTTILSQHDHFRRLMAAQQNETRYYADQVDRLQHQLQLANRQHIAVATSLTQLTADNAALRERLREQQQNAAVESRNNEDKACVGIRRADYCQPPEDLSILLCKMEELQMEKNRLRKLVMILLRLLLHR